MGKPTETTYATANGPARSAYAVTPSDTDNLETPAKALYIGTAGDVKVDLVTNGTGIVFKNHPVGYMLVQVKKVYDTGTAAQNIVALVN